MDLETLLHHINIGEDRDVEFKLADGGLPNDVWETVSAFANTDGGYVVLGVSEGKSGFVISGVRNSDRLLKNFWDNHNNPQKLNKPICSNSDVQLLNVEAKNVLIIRVPRAMRTQRPVYINNNPMTGTYKRNFEGDYRCTLEEVQQMFQDASNEPQARSHYFGTSASIWRYL